MVLLVIYFINTHAAELFVFSHNYALGNVHTKPFVRYFLQKKKDLPFWSVVSRCLLFHSAIYSPVFSSWIIISKKMDMIKYNSVLLCFLLIKIALIDFFLKYIPFLFWSFQTVWQTFPTASWVSVRGAFTNIHVCGSSVMLEQIQWFSAKRKTHRLPPPTPGGTVR